MVLSDLRGSVVDRLGWSQKKRRDENYPTHLEFLIYDVPEPSYKHFRIRRHHCRKAYLSMDRRRIKELSIG